MTTWRWNVGDYVWYRRGGRQLKATVTNAIGQQAITILVNDPFLGRPANAVTVYSVHPSLLTRRIEMVEAEPLT